VSERAVLEHDGLPQEGAPRCFERVARLEDSDRLFVDEDGPVTQGDLQRRTRVELEAKESRAIRGDVDFLVDHGAFLGTRERGSEKCREGQAQKGITKM
jgi:hypothetical protein